MGEYFINVQIDFEGTTQEKDKFKKLLLLMDKEEIFDEDDFDESPYKIDDIYGNALLGELEDRGENRPYDSRYYPDFDLTLAPKLFAALFPKSSFSYWMSVGYDGGDFPEVFQADYKDGKLLVKQCRIEEELDDDILERCEGENMEIWEIIEMSIESKNPEELDPSINDEYVKSFFSEGDIFEFLKITE